MSTAPGPPRTRMRPGPPAAAVTAPQSTNDAVTRSRIPVAWSISTLTAIAERELCPAVAWSSRCCSAASVHLFCELLDRFAQSRHC